jgi:hypothetical protein
MMTRERLRGLRTKRGFQDASVEVACSRFVTTRRADGCRRRLPARRASREPYPRCAPGRARVSCDDSMARENESVKAAVFAQDRTQPAIVMRAERSDEL